MACVRRGGAPFPGGHACAQDEAAQGDVTFSDGPGCPPLRTFALARPETDSPTPHAADYGRQPTFGGSSLAVQRAGWPNLDLSPLPEVAVAHSPNGKILVEVRPVQSKRGQFDISELPRRALRKPGVDGCFETNLGAAHGPPRLAYRRMSKSLVSGSTISPMTNDAAATAIGNQSPE